MDQAALRAPPRPSMSAARRVRIFEAHSGVCYLCSEKIKLTELWDIEHVRAWALSYDDTDENLRPAHKNGCHEAKTKDDVKRIAKAKRQSGVEGGQYAKRQKNGPRLKSANRWPPNGSVKIQSKPFARKDDR